MIYIQSVHFSDNWYLVSDIEEFEDILHSNAIVLVEITSSLHRAEHRSAWREASLREVLDPAHHENTLFVHAGLDHATQLKQGF